MIKTMLTDDTVLENEDLHILGRLKKFLLEDEVASTSLSKQLLSVVNNMVCTSRAQHFRFFSRKGPVLKSNIA